MRKKEIKDTYLDLRMQFGVKQSIEFTARKLGLTTDEVRRALGFIQ